LRNAGIPANQTLGLQVHERGADAARLFPRRTIIKKATLLLAARSLVFLRARQASRNHSLAST
jgi:hypothetical protein